MMARKWTSSHGHRWGYPGIAYRPQHSQAKPWRVQYLRQKRWVHVGYYTKLADAQKAAKQFRGED